MNKSLRYRLAHRDEINERQRLKRQALKPRHIFCSVCGVEILGWKTSKKTNCSLRCVNRKRSKKKMAWFRNNRDRVHPMKLEHQRLWRRRTGRASDKKWLSKFRELNGVNYSTAQVRRVCNLARIGIGQKKSCEFCGKYFVPMGHFGRNKFCGKTCANKSHAYLTDYERKIGPQGRLTRSYVSNLIARNTQLVGKDFPPEIVEIKRKQITALRLIKKKQTKCT